MLVRVLGAAAGGGFPQWNCNCQNCRRARTGDPLVKPRTQASLAVSVDGRHWVLLNASPDLPAQINAAACLQSSSSAPRHSPISAVIISGGDVDCLAGLLSLRESQSFYLYADKFVRGILAENSLFRVLNPAFVTSRDLPPGRVTELAGPEGPLGLTAEAFHVPGKIPLYQETSNNPANFQSATAVIGLRLTAGGSNLFYIPACAAVTHDLLARIQPADILFFDGTLWQDDEMITSGTGIKTGFRMGHISVSDSLAAFAGTRARKIFIHINNTNPILRDDSPQAAAVRAAGWDIAYDGMELSL